MGARPRPVGIAVKVDDLDGRGAFRALAPAWDALAARAGLPGPFQRAGFFAVQAAWLARPPRRLRLLLAHQDGSLEGALPLLAERRALAGVPARLLRSLSDDHTQRFDLLAADPAAIDALWRHLAADPGWDALELRDLPDGSAGAALAERAARDGFPTGEWPSQRSPFLALPASAGALDAALPARLRANLRRRARGLEAELGEVRLQRIGPGAPARAIDAALADGFDLEASGWKGRAGTAIARDPALAARYRALAHLFARSGELSLHFLAAGDRRVAFHFALESGGVYYLFKPGYDESLARFGPGQLLLHRVAGALCDRGAREIDFLGEDLPWKRAWTDRVRPHRFRYVFRPNRFGRALAAWKLSLAPALRRFATRLRTDPA
jgi:CelD/BcsL family acetyltransferase involved in cellulose biosynthesis